MTDESLKQYLKSIADALRGITGSTELINPQNFVNVIESINTGDTSDLDYIKYQDNMTQIETGKIPPTDEEYEQILKDGYKILDYIFRGEKHNGNE